MNDEELAKMCFVMESIRGITAGLGGQDEDVFFIAAVAKAMALAPEHEMTSVDRVRRINAIAGEAEFVLRGLFEKKTKKNGR